MKASDKNGLPSEKLLEILAYPKAHLTFRPDLLVDEEGDPVATSFSHCHRERKGIYPFDCDLYCRRAVDNRFSFHFNSGKALFPGAVKIV
jgi:hypothetical protein